MKRNQFIYAPLLSAVLLLCLLWPSTSPAKVDPMGIITQRLQRAEVAIVLDTSGSMAWFPSPATRVGSDCGGDRKGTVDLCGDSVTGGIKPYVEVWKEVQ